MRKLRPFAKSINRSAENSRCRGYTGANRSLRHHVALCAAPQPTHGLLLLRGSLTIRDHLDNFSSRIPLGVLDHASSRIQDPHSGMLWTILTVYRLQENLKSRVARRLVCMTERRRVQWRVVAACSVVGKRPGAGWAHQLIREWSPCLPALTVSRSVWV